MEFFDEHFQHVLIILLYFCHKSLIIYDIVQQQLWRLSLGYLFCKHVTIQCYYSCENVSMLSARLNFFILEEIQGKYSKHFLLSGKRDGNTKHYLKVMHLSHWTDHIWILSPAHELMIIIVLVILTLLNPFLKRSKKVRKKAKLSFSLCFTEENELCKIQIRKIMRK